MSHNNNTQIKRKPIKEFIYVDDIELNSVLAQFEDGIPQVIKSIQQSTLSVGESNSKGKKKTVSGGIKAGIHGDAGFEDKDTREINEVNGNMTQQAIETIYSDYAINIVEKRLDSSQLLKVTSKQEDGAFVKLQSTFKLLDLEALDKFWSSDSILPSMKFAEDFEEHDEEWQLGLSAMKAVASLLNNSFPNTTFVKLKNSLVYAENKNFRLNSAQLQTLAHTTRKLTVLGKVESILSEEDINIDNFDIGDSLENLGETMPALGLYFLSIFSGIKKDDRLIKPIAIYFE